MNEFADDMEAFNVALAAMQAAVVSFLAMLEAPSEPDEQGFVPRPTLRRGKP